MSHYKKEKKGRSKAQDVKSYTAKAARPSDPEPNNDPVEGEKHQGVIDQKNQSSNSAGKENMIKWINENWDKLLGLIVQITLAIFTGLLFFKAASQTRSAQDAVRISDSIYRESQREFIVENRPYLLIVGQSDTIFNDRMSCAIVVENFGKSPAIVNNVTYEILGTYSQTIDTFNYDHKAFSDTKMILQPQMSDIIQTKSIEMNKNELSKWEKGVYCVFIYGRINYTDLSSQKERHYQFCIRIHQNHYLMWNPTYNNLDNEN